MSSWQADPARLPNVYDLFPELAQAERLDAGDTPSCSAAAALAAQDAPPLSCQSPPLEYPARLSNAGDCR
ncbi:hypothetical protein [uncultured Thiodictyon sp.]|uniref:hypothetical protein n=1 Tax=uncultured Thiodictyon sp. TaxID=1846217 RepID=UPI0025F38F72|nr:hypothetical protein [uncultured Thiodictyon sp.]